MIKLLNRTTYLLLYLFLFSPILSYFTLGLMGLRSITVYFSVISIFYGLLFVFIKGNSLEVPRYIYFLIAYSIYTIIWGFFNGKLEKIGFINLLINWQVNSVIFIIIIIYNTYFTDKFVNNSIVIIKYTVIIAAAVSAIQVVYVDFLNADAVWKNEINSSYIIENIYLMRRQSIFGYVNQNEVGLSFVPLLSVLIGFLLFKKQRGNLLFYLLLGGIVAILSNARYIMIAYLIILLQLFVNKESTNRIKALIIVLVSFFLISQVISYFNYNFYDWFYARLFPEQSIEQTSRYKAISTFLIFFPKKVIFGFGGVTRDMTIDSLAIGSSQIHVGYLAHLVYFGMVGSIFLFGFWISLANHLYKNAKFLGYWGSFFAFLVFLWANMTLVYFSIFFYGIIYALVFDKYFKDKKVIIRNAI